MPMHLCAAGRWLAERDVRRYRRVYVRATYVDRAFFADLRNLTDYFTFTCYSTMMVIVIGHQ